MGSSSFLALYAAPYSSTIKLTISSSSHTHTICRYETIKYSCLIQQCFSFLSYGCVFIFEIIVWECFCVTSAFNFISLHSWNHCPIFSNSVMCKFTSLNSCGCYYVSTHEFIVWVICCIIWCSEFFCFSCYQILNNYVISKFN